MSFFYSSEWSHAGLVRFKNGPEVVMVAGGDHSNTVEMFNLDTWVWSYHTTWSEYLAGGMCVPYGDTFLIVGGEVISGDYSTDIIWFNLDTEAWETRPEVVPSQTAYSAAFFVPDELIECIEPTGNDVLFVVGGYGDDITSAIDFSGMGRICTKIPDLPVNRGVKGTFINNKVIACGGKYFYLLCWTYNPVANIWEPASNMMDEHYYHEGINLSDDEWWITGGQNADREMRVITEIYR